jgi:hypothetical protein
MAIVTVIVIESPVKCNAKLQPWLAIANLAAEPGGPWRRPDGLLIEPANADEEQYETGAAYLRSEIERWPELTEILDIIEVPSVSFGADPWRADEWAFRFVHFVAAAISFCAQKSGVRAIEMPGTLAEFREYQGQVQLVAPSPALKFIEALNQAEWARIGCCPICGQFFYVVRANGKSGKAGTKACSRNCTLARKQREYRKREREHSERALKLKQEGNNVNEIARELQVTIKKARAYIGRGRNLAAKASRPIEEE